LRAAGFAAAGVEVVAAGFAAAGVGVIGVIVIGRVYLMFILLATELVCYQVNIF
jgi:hypothetical protein